MPLRKNKCVAQWVQVCKVNFSLWISVVGVGLPIVWLCSSNVGVLVVVSIMSMIFKFDNQPNARIEVQDTLGWGFRLVVVKGTPLTSGRSPLRKRAKCIALFLPHKMP